MPSDQNNNKVPGIRKNPEKPGKPFLELSDDEQKRLIEQELGQWRLRQMDVGKVPHNIFNMDAMLIALVRTVSKELGISEDVLNRHYRHVVYEKLTDIRRDAGQATRIFTPKGDVQI